MSNIDLELIDFQIKQMNLKLSKELRTLETINVRLLPEVYAEKLLSLTRLSISFFNLVETGPLITFGVSSKTYQFEYYLHKDETDRNFEKEAFYELIVTIGKRKYDEKTNSYTPSPLRTWSMQSIYGSMQGVLSPFKVTHNKVFLGKRRVG